MLLFVIARLVPSTARELDEAISGDCRASLAMTESEGLAMTESEGLAMTESEGLAMTRSEEFAMT